MQEFQIHGLLCMCRDLEHKEGVGRVWGLYVTIFEFDGLDRCLQGLS